jgi:hypothetical protein
MQDIHGGYWRRSFATESSSLAELMEDWLRSPTFSQQVASHERRGGARQQALGSAREGEDGAAEDQDG